MTADIQRIPVQNQIPTDEGADELNIGELLSILWAGRFKLLLAVFFTISLGVLYLIQARPVYEANGMVQVEESSKGLGSSMGDLSSLFGAPMETQAEIQILQSRMVLTKVIEALKLEIHVEPHYFPVFGQFIARHRKGSGELPPPLFGLPQFTWGGEVADISVFDVPVELLGESMLLVVGEGGAYELSNADDQRILSGKVGELASVEFPEGGMRIFVKELRAHPGARFAVTRFALADVLRALDDSLKVAEQGKQSGVIGLTVEGPNPQYVANVIRQMQDAYLRQNVERRSAEAQQSLEFLQQQLPEIRGRADTAQAKLNAYQLRQGSVNVTKETELVLQQAVDFETNRLGLMQQRQQAIQRFTAQHPVVQALDAQIRNVEKEQAAIKKRSETLPETQQEVLSLMRDLEVNTQIYTTLLNSAQELQVAKAGTVGNVRIIDYPLVPSKKAKPKSVVVLAFSIVAGLFLGVGYLFLQKALFKGVDRPDEVESKLGLPTYAAVPYAQAQRKLALAAHKKQSGNHILAAVDPKNVAIEALRSLRTSIQFALLEAHNNVLMFTGPTPGLGKSFVSVNLAAVLAKAGKKVVVIDADMRRGHLHKYVGQGATPGLSDYVVGSSDLQGILRKTEVDGLTLIANGTTPPNPSELLLHERFGQLLKVLSDNFDLVIIDTPPVLPVTDACVIGRLAGCVLVVLKEGAHPMRMVEETIRRLRQAGVVVRGTIFNQVGQRGGGYGYYYSSYGYSYGSEYQSESR
jgi:tyrosine-protein kinase Etk/Wzc